MNPILAMMMFWAVAVKGAQELAGVWNLHKTFPKNTQSSKQDVE
jgi:hypothetical protein